MILDDSFYLFLSLPCTPVHFVECIGIEPRQLLPSYFPDYRQSNQSWTFVNVNYQIRNIRLQLIDYLISIFI